jgi:hypothetical protein
MLRSHRWVVLVLSLPWLVAAAPPVATTVVASAPGYPGTTTEAQAAMDTFASALARTAHWPEGSASAVYYPKEADGVARLGKPDAGVALVTLPFYLAHREDLGLKARLAVEMKSVGVTERWTLVAKKGRVKTATDLANMTVSSIAGYAPSFVRGALASWGRIPETAKVETTTQVLSALRKAATGPDQAVLLDGEQAASLSSLPFAKDLEVVARSEPMPAALVATVRNNTPEKRWPEIERALLALSSDPKGIEALGTIRMVRFAPLDNATLAAATAACGAGAKK